MQNTQQLTITLPLDLAEATGGKIKSGAMHPSTRSFATACVRCLSVTQ